MKKDASIFTRTCVLLYSIALWCSALQNDTQDIQYVFAKDIRGNNTRRIFGGNAAKRGEAPHVVALIAGDGRQLCSGTAIASHWCLTAAHCVVTVIQLIRYNSMNALYGGKTVGVSAKYKHPEYNVIYMYQDGVPVSVHGLYHDVGLVKTSQEMVFPNFPEVNPYDVTGRYVVVFGFGRVWEGVNQRHDLMRSSMQMSNCDMKLWVYCLCAYSTIRDAVVCAGDSGGPSFFKGTVVSVTSLGPVECAPSSDSPYSVVTKLSPYVAMINNTMNGKSVNVFAKVEAAENLQLNKCLLLAVFVIYI